MLPVTVNGYVSAPREEIFDFVADLGARVAWCDHFMEDYRLADPVPSGIGAAARYVLDAPLARTWVETQVVELDRPRRMAEATRGGRAGRARGEIVWELSRHGHGLVKVEMTAMSDPGTVRERLKEALGFRRWYRRQAKLALERLRVIFEERPDGPLARATIAGWEPAKGPRFGASVRG
jgi:hypothetical protein